MNELGKKLMTKLEKKGFYAYLEEKPKSKTEILDEIENYFYEEDETYEIVEAGEKPRVKVKDTIYKANLERIQFHGIPSWSIHFVEE